MVFNDRCAYVSFPSLKIYEIKARQSIQELSKSIYIPRGINTEALDRNIKWDFTPTNVKVPLPISSSHVVRRRLKDPATGRRPRFWRRHIRQSLRKFTR